MSRNKNKKEEPLEKQLWKAADKRRENIDAAEYKHIVLGLIFLKYISDARNTGHLINRRTREFSDEDIQKTAQTYHNWHTSTGSAHTSIGSAASPYEDIKGFCKSATGEEVAKLDCVPTPGCCVGLPDNEDDFDFNKRFTKLTAG